jgi:hypothetical protein
MSELEDSRIDVLSSKIMIPNEVRELFKKVEGEAKHYAMRLKKAAADCAEFRVLLAERDGTIAKLTLANRQLQADLSNEMKRSEDATKKSNVLREKMDVLRKEKGHPQNQPKSEVTVEGEASSHSSSSSRSLALSTAEARIVELESLLSEKSHEWSLSEAKMKMEMDEARKESEACRGKAMSEYDAQLTRMKEKLERSESMRIKLHNQVCIRVCVYEIEGGDRSG